MAGFQSSFAAVLRQKFDSTSYGQFFLSRFLQHYTTTGYLGKLYLQAPWVYSAGEPF